jgi:hypothetical protein
VDEAHVRADRARVQERLVVHVAEVDHRAHARGSHVTRFLEVGGDVVLTGEVVERSTGQNRELGVRPRQDSRGCGDGAVAASH